MKKSKLAFFGILVFITVNLGACSEGPFSPPLSPENTVKSFFDSLISFDVKKAVTYVTTGNADFTYDSKEEEEIVKQLFTRIKYRIISTTVNKDTAIVKTEIMAPDSVKIMKEALSNNLQDLFSAALSDEPIGQNESLQTVVELIAAKLSKPDVPMLKGEVDIRLSIDRSRNMWLIEPEEDFRRAITGRVGEALDEMGGSWEGQAGGDEKAAIYPANREAEAEGATVTVLKAERSQGEAGDLPKKGMEYVIVTVKIRNVQKDDDELDYNAYDFELQNSMGQIKSGAFTEIDTDTYLGSGRLAKNGEVTGTIPFEVPAGDSELTLLYSPFLKPVLRFKLTVSEPEKAEAGPTTIIGPETEITESSGSKKIITKTIEKSISIMESEGDLTEEEKALLESLGE